MTTKYGVPDLNRDLGKTLYESVALNLGGGFPSVED